MVKTLVFGLLAVGTVAVLASCSKGGPPTTPEQAAEDRAQSLEAYDFPIGSTDIEGGAAVFEEFCEGCHPGGEEGDGPKIAGISESASELRFRVRSGGDDMPAFDSSKISDEDLEALVAYTVTLGVVDPSL
ncbi:MAG: cytochrome c [Deltaproteobacteria bacterium]|nr:cytochrome c [Deltaproteobacteria bacterium]